MEMRRMPTNGGRCHAPSRPFLTVVFLSTLCSLAIPCSLAAHDGDRAAAVGANDFVVATAINQTLAASVALPAPRIVGGAPVAPDAYPFLSFTAGAMLCAATLIWPDVLLSAGHCQDHFADGAIVSGILLSGADGTLHGVDRVLVHPDYPATQGSAPNDIMLVKLSTPSTVQPVVFATDPTLPSEGSVVFILGYGATAEGGAVSNTLQAVDVPVSNFQNCSAYYSGAVLEQNHQFCNDASQGKDSCQGDSGGPLLNAYGEQVGVVSYGEGCAQVVSVNTRVAAYAAWIQASLCTLSASPPIACSVGSAPAAAPAVPPPPTGAPDAAVASGPAPVALTTTSAPERAPTPAPTSAPTPTPTPAPTPAPASSPPVPAPTTTPAAAHFPSNSPSFDPAPTLAPITVPTSAGLQLLTTPPAVVVGATATPASLRTVVPASPAVALGENASSNQTAPIPAVPSVDEGSSVVATSTTPPRLAPIVTSAAQAAPSMYGSCAAVVACAAVAML